MDTDRLQSHIQRQGRVIAGFLLVVGFLIVRHCVVAPHLTALQASQQYEDATHERIKKGKVVNHELRAKRARLEKLEVQCTSLSGMAFSPAQAEEFLSDLEAFCEHSGCVIASLSFLNSEDQTSHDSGLAIVARGAALTVHGTYASVTRLIGKLQARQEKVWIDKLSIETLAPDPNRVVCYLTITIYVNFDEENVGHENGPIHN